MVYLILWVIAALLVGAALLGVAKQAMPLLPASIQPFGGLIYALVVLLVVVLFVQAFFAGIPSLHIDPFPR